MTKIQEIIEKLPDLSETVFKLQKMREQPDTEIVQVLDILEENRFIVAKIMKIANSKLFRFANRIDTLNNAVLLFGINFTTSVAISESINNSLIPKLNLYPITKEEFFQLSEKSTKLMMLWLKKDNLVLKEELITPCLISRIGTFLVSDLVQKEEHERFLLEIKENPTKVFQIEKKFTNFSSSEITAKMLEYWGFDEKLINIIKNIDNLNSKQSAILAVLNLIFNPISPFSKESILQGLTLADKFNLNPNRLKEAIEEFITLNRND